MAVPLNDIQRGEVREMIHEGLNLLPQEKQIQLTTVRQELIDAGRTFETQNTEFQNLQANYQAQIDAKQQSVIKYLEEADKKREENNSVLEAEFAAKQQHIDRLVHEINAKQAEMEAIRQAIEVVLSRAQAGLQQQGSEVRREATVLVEQLRTKTSNEVNRSRREVAEISGRIAAIAQVIESGGNIGSGSGMGGGMKFLEKGLIDPREQNMPEFVL